MYTLNQGNMAQLIDNHVSIYEHVGRIEGQRIYYKTLVEGGVHCE